MSKIQKKFEDLSDDEKIRAFEKALEMERLKSTVYETMIEIAEKEYGLDIRGVSAKQTNTVNKKKLK